MKDRTATPTDPLRPLLPGHPGPEGVPHRPVAPLATRNPRLESTPTVPGTLIPGRDRYPLEVLHQLVECEMEWPLDVPLQAEPPRAQVDGIRNEVQVIAYVKRGIRGERRQKVGTRGLELDSPVGNPKERQLLRIADERIDTVPVGIGAWTGEAGERRRGLRLHLGASRPTAMQNGGPPGHASARIPPGEAARAPVCVSLVG